MLFHDRELHALHSLRSRELQRSVEAERLVRRPPRRVMRRVVGHSMVRLGHALAAEPHRQPARSR